MDTQMTNLVPQEPVPSAEVQGNPLPQGHEDSQEQTERLALAVFDRILFVIFGASLALGALLPFMVLMDLPRHPGVPDFAWLAVWMLLQISLIGSLAYLLGLGSWGQHTSPARNRLVARFFALIWLGACEFVAWVAAYGMDMGDLARGLVKMVAEAGTGRILGVHLFMPQAAEIIHEAALAVRLGLTVRDLVETIHVYPTLSEALRLVAQSFTRDISRLSCCAE